MDVEPGYVQKLVRQFEAQLLDDEFDATVTWQELGPLLAEAIGSENTARLDQQMRDIDLAAALTSLQALLQERPALRE